MKPRGRKPRSVLLERKAEEQQRIREIHSALGGSAEAFDRTADEPEGDVSLGSRIDAYIKLQTAGRGSAPAPEPAEPVFEPPLVLEAAPPAPVEAPPAPVAEPPVQLVAAPVARPPAPQRVREARVKAPRGPSAISRARTAVAPRIRAGASGLARALRGSALLLVQLVLAAARRLTAAATHVRRAVRAAASGPRAARERRAARPPRRRVERRDPERLSPTVLERVHGYAPPVADDAPVDVVPAPEPEPEPAVEPVVPWPPVAERQDEPRQAQVVRPAWTKPRMLLVAAALTGAAVAAVLVVGRGHGGGAAENPAAVRAMADASASRTSFASPLAYAGAMTRLALANGRTQVDGEPACDAKSTWKRWSCNAKGRPSLGPYAGRWVTYRCTPSYATQAGAPATLVVNCRPQTQTPPTTPA